MTLPAPLTADQHRERARTLTAAADRTVLREDGAARTYLSRYAVDVPAALYAGASTHAALAQLADPRDKAHPTASPVERARADSAARRLRHDTGDWIAAHSGSAARDLAAVLDDRDELLRTTGARLPAPTREAPAPAGTPLNGYMPDADTAATHLRAFLDDADRQGVENEHLRSIAAVINDRDDLRQQQSALAAMLDAAATNLDTLNDALAERTAQRDDARTSRRHALALHQDAEAAVVRVRQERDAARTTLTSLAVPEGITARRLDAARAVARATAATRVCDLDALRDAAPDLYRALTHLAVAHDTLEAGWAEESKPEPETTPPGLCPETCTCRLHAAYPRIDDLIRALRPLTLPEGPAWALDAVLTALPEMNGPIRNAANPQPHRWTAATTPYRAATHLRQWANAVQAGQHAAGPDAAHRPLFARDVLTVLDDRERHAQDAADQRAKQAAAAADLATAQDAAADALRDRDTVETTAAAWATIPDAFQHVILLNAPELHRALDPTSPAHPGPRLAGTDR